MPRTDTMIWLHDDRHLRRHKRTEVMVPIGGDSVLRLCIEAIGPLHPENEPNEDYAGPDDQALHVATQRAISVVRRELEVIE